MWVLHPVRETPRQTEHCLRRAGVAVRRRAMWDTGVNAAPSKSTPRPSAAYPQGAAPLSPRSERQLVKNCSPPHPIYKEAASSQRPSRRVSATSNALKLLALRLAQPDRNSTRGSQAEKQRVPFSPKDRFRKVALSPKPLLRRELCVLRQVVRDFVPGRL